MDNRRFLLIWCMQRVKKENKKDLLNHKSIRSVNSWKLPFENYTINSIHLISFFVLFFLLICQCYMVAVVFQSFNLSVLPQPNCRNVKSKWTCSGYKFQMLLLFAGRTPFLLNRKMRFVVHLLFFRFLLPHFCCSSIISFENLMRGHLLLHTVGFATTQQ